MSAGTAELIKPNGTGEVAKPTTAKGWLQSDQFKQAVTQALPRHVSPDRFLRAGLTALTKTPKLANCTPESFLAAMLTLSQMGLEPDGRRAHLIPFGDQVQLIVDYKGLAELVMRSGIVSYLHADVVCENDVFEHDKGEIKKHLIDFKGGNRGAVYATYALCRFKDGTEKAEVLTRQEVEDVRKRSRAGKSGPWVTDWNEMAKKTAFRRLSKWLPLSSEVREALESDDDRLEHGTREEAIVLSHAGDSKTDQLAEMLAKSSDDAEAARGEESHFIPPDESSNATDDVRLPPDLIAVYDELCNPKIGRDRNAALMQEVGARRGELSEAQWKILDDQIKANVARFTKK